MHYGSDALEQRRMNVNDLGAVLKVCCVQTETIAPYRELLWEETFAN